ncbi:MAG: hypothetical protein JW895_07610 [Thermoleophilaceae bacterium]|nr:hypothetical protein [Thermoleophilaceae bacterium]
MTSSRRVLAVATVCALGTWLGVAEAWARPVHIRGTAYEFSNTKVKLGGAIVRVAERPRVRATVRRDGSYDLVVPDRASITPYITAAGYHTIYLQTFRTAGEDLARVNFQTPRDAIYRALAGLLEVPLDERGELRQCAIVSTFSTRNVRDLSFNGFTGYGAHGVAGATAFARPALPPPVYFNEDVIPDPLQELSSVDGGVVWTRVPAGAYRIRARHPSTRFASFLATCRPGRVINANPPWGLHELGLRNTAKVSLRWSGTRLRRFRVTNLPPAATVRLSCTGSGCPFKRRSVKANDPVPVDLLEGLRPGQTLEVRLTAHGYDGKLVRYRLRSGQSPKPVTLCLPLGSTKPRPHC